MKENKVKIIIFVSLMFLFLGIGLVVWRLQNSKENPNNIHDPLTDNYKYTNVSDINEYQTIYNCIRNYYRSINQSQNTLLDLLFENYKNKNSIAANNVSNYVEKQYQNFAYEITKLQKYSNSYYSFYFIVGKYAKEELDDLVDEITVQDVVIWDTISNTYAVMPVLNTNDTFEKLINNFHFDTYSEKIKKNSNNEVKFLTVSDYNEVTMYFSDYIKLLITDCASAYKIIGEETKKTYKNFNEFRALCNTYNTENAYPTVQNYKIAYKEGKKNISITDNYSIKYNFVLDNVKEYKVDITK